MVYYKKYQRKGSGVKKGNLNYTAYKRIQYKRGIKQSRDKMGAYGKPPTLQKVISLINRAINKNVENKTSDTIEHSANVCKFPFQQAYTMFYKSFNGIFDNIQQGAGANQRLGNRFKLKCLWVNIMIHPDDTYLNNYDPGAAETPFPPHPKALDNTYQGILTFYLGKRIDGVPFDDKVVNLYQQGNISITPQGRLYDQLYPDNKDVYKIYYKRKMKCGMSEVPDLNTSYVVHANTSTTNGNTTTYATQRAPTKYQNIPMMPNNDYKLTHKFKFNVCNFIGKNATIKFNDGGNQTANVPSTLHGLTMWATWSPCVGNVVQAVSGANTSAVNAFYKVHSTISYEYEDA